MQKESTPSLREKLQDMKQRIIASGQYQVSEDKTAPGANPRISLGKRLDNEEPEDRDWDLYDEEEVLVAMEDELPLEEGINDAEDVSELDENDVEPAITEDPSEQAPDLGIHLAREIPDMEIGIDEFDPQGDLTPTYIFEEENEPVSPVEILGEEFDGEEGVFNVPGKTELEKEEIDPELLAMEREYFGIVDEVIAPVIGALQAEEQEEDFVFTEQSLERVLENDEKEEVDFFGATQEYLREETARAKAEGKNIEKVKETVSKQDKDASLMKEEGKDGPGGQTAVFLKDGLDIEEETPQIYSLAEEFKKNKKNRNILFYVIILSFIVFLGAGTYFISRDIQDETRRAEINIREFDDINLQELVNTAKEAEDRINKLKNELQTSRNDLEGKLDEIRRQAELRVAGLRAQNLSAEERGRLEAEIRREEQKRINTAQSEFEEQIAAKQRELNQARSKQGELEEQLKNRAQEYEERLKERMADYEKELKAKVGDYETQFKERLEKIQEQALSQRQSHQGELKETRELYEAKLKALAKQHEAELEYLKRYYAKQMEAIQSARDKALDNLRLALETQKNREIAELRNRLQSEYSELEAKNSKTIAELETVIKKYRFAFAFYTAKTREHGYVIDASEEGEIIAEVNRFYRVKIGDQGVVSNDVGETLARIKFTSVNGFLRAKIVEREKDKKIRPFDRILLEVSE